VDQLPLRPLLHSRCAALVLTAAVAIGVGGATAQASVVMSAPGVMLINGLPNSPPAGRVVYISGQLPMTVHPDGALELQQEQLTPVGTTGTTGTTGVSGVTAATGSTSPPADWQTLASARITFRSFTLRWSVPAGAVGSPLVLRFFLERNGRELAVSQTISVAVTAAVAPGQATAVRRPRHANLLRGMAGLSSAVAMVLDPLGTVGALGSTGDDVSHAGWPHFDTLYLAGNEGQVMIGTDGNDEMLGGPGSDTFYGGPGNDVIWGDRYPSPNGPDQTDRIYAGSGNNWIYTSHGYNIVHMGSGNNHVFAFYGHGTINCGPGHNIVYVQHPAFNEYTLKHCEVVRQW
jgi:Ca2+-binding RTX toxin-like protein